MNDDSIRGGMKVRREVLGDEHVDRAIANTTEFTATFRTSSPGTPGASLDAAGLDRRTRELLTLAVLAALRPRTRSRCTSGRRSATG